MKKTGFALLAFIFLAFTVNWKDGRFIGISRSYYTNEPYYGTSSITIENGIITDVEFYIRDSAKHEHFDDNYEKYFAGNNLYVEQCRNDRKGIMSYPDSLLKYQDIGEVDVISGATWSYNIFKASVQNALSKAREE